MSKSVKKLSLETKEEIIEAFIKASIEALYDEGFRKLEITIKGVKIEC